MNMANKRMNGKVERQAPVRRPLRSLAPQSLPSFLFFYIPSSLHWLILPSYVMFTRDVATAVGIL
jgi:hypothetical protein